MQYKKDELKAVILCEAEREFLDKGYMNASLRQIAKRSGTTIGNLYNYYVSKEALFDELVKSEYDSFIYLLKGHSSTDISFDSIDLNDITMSEKILDEFIGSLMPVFSKRFLILIDQSGGTKYENTKDEFIEFMHRHFLEHTEVSKTKVSPEFSKLVAAQIIYGLIYIIRNYEDEKVKQKLIHDLFLFNIIGVMGILNN